MRQESIWNKRIPTLFALVLLVLGVSVTAFITRKNTIFRSGAAPSEAPKNIQVTNSSDTSFTVTFTTDTPTLGSISFGANSNLRTILLDDRDQTTNTPHEYTTHSITVKNLSANTQYYFSVISGDTTYTNNGVPFNTTTGPPLSGQPLLKQVISGTITLSATNNSGVLVYVQTPDGEPLSTISDLQGNYHISLENLRTSDLRQYVSLQKDDVISLTFTDGTALSHVSTNIANNLIPTITLSQDYNFTSNQGQQQTQSQPLAESFPLFSTLSTNNNETPVMQTATPSATAVPTLTIIPTTGTTVTPTQTIATTTATPTQTLTTTPTVGATATPAPTIGATATPPMSPTGFIPSPTKAPLPSTGNDSIFTIGVVSIIMTFIGFGLFFATKGSREL